MSRLVRAAAAHISPEILSANQTTQKAISHIGKAAKQDANLIAFPESYIPAFPLWSTFLPPAKAHHLFQRLVQESVYADGEEIRAIREAAARSKIIVSLGFTEKVRYSSATLFNSNLIIGNTGDVLVHHRKLVPTWVEKLTWAAGDGYGLRVAETDSGRIGALICGENTNPLARYAMMAQGEEIHISCWPALWASRIDSFEGNIAPPAQADDILEPVPAASKPKNYDNVAANRTRASAHCFEAKCFGIMCAPYMSKENISTLAGMTEDPSRSTKILEGTPKGASMFLDPTGATLPGFIVDEQGKHHPRDVMQHEEGILYADMDLNQCIEGKQYHDVVGGYQRFDVFDVKVNRTRQKPIAFDDSH